MTNQSIIQPIEMDPMFTEDCLVDFDVIASQSEADLMIGLVLDGFYDLCGGRKWDVGARC
jgi:hypothetical protein